MGIEELGFANAILSPCAGIGIRNGLKIHQRKLCGFDSRWGHQALDGLLTGFGFDPVEFTCHWVRCEVSSVGSLVPLLSLR